MGRTPASVLALTLAACYGPTPGTGVPCAANGDCPGTQVCDRGRAEPVCVDTLADAGVADTPLDASVPWSEPVEVELEIDGVLDDPTLSADELELYFNLDDADIYVARRASIDDAWGAPELVVELSDPVAPDTTPELARDGLTMLIASRRAPATSLDFFRATRTSRAEAWGAPVHLPELGTPGRNETSATLSDDELSVYWGDERDPLQRGDLFVATRTSRTAPFGPHVILDRLNTTTDEGSPFLASNNLELYFGSARDGDLDLYVARRDTVEDRFGRPEAIPELDSPADEQDVWISTDGRRMYFTSERSGTSRIYVSSR